MFTQHHSDTRRGPLRPFLAAAVLVACAGLAACTAAQPPTSAGTAPAADVQPVPDGDLAAGTYVYSDFTVPLEITVPAGWEYSAEGAFSPRATPS